MTTVISLLILLCFLAVLVAACAAVTVVIGLGIFSLLNDCRDCLRQVAATAQEVVGVEFCCNDPDCPDCNPIEEGEEWKRGRSDT